MVEFVDYVEDMKRAVLAERERCAKVCDKQAEEFKEFAKHSAVIAATAVIAAKACAAVIRKGS